MIRRVFCLVIAIHFLLIGLPGVSACQGNGSAVELNWDYQSSYTKDRDLDTVSLHILKKSSESKSETKNRSVYRGITITRPTGSITFEQQTGDSAAVGVGPIYLIRNEKYLSDKLSAAVDMSGGFIVYDRSFPAGGRWYNFMWRIGPQFIYRFGEDSSVHVGYMLTHVSNGLRSHNPGDDARGVSFGFVTKF
jgi:hypothetical protein